MKKKELINLIVDKLEEKTDDELEGFLEELSYDSPVLQNCEGYYRDEEEYEDIREYSSYDDFVM